MIVCVCNGVSDRQVKAAIRNGAASVEDLSASLGVGVGCGCCRETCADLISDAQCAGTCTSMLHTYPVFSLMPVTA